MFEWKEEYSTDVKSIDEQHQKLLEIGGRLYELVKDMKAYEEGDFYDDIAAVLDELAEYTVYHFEHEEKLMEENNYPDLDKHRVVHTKFVNKVNELRDKDIDADQKEFLLETVEFVADWVSNHILKVDQDYKILFKLKGVE